ncbi:hypothetical protein [Microlunatus flavus]|uniref:Uncharacterized protein n=1 Tax=Microlunatus flavus TaxID=1036181 RepID=A0A1H8ZDS2_9ACTN|nr:hypothetical protein [Microlunatus flavus]SEP62317.1 hypothetical protein SAMN05421756_101197 [Microlunatus flavus]
MSVQAAVRTVSDPTFCEVRRAAEALVTELGRHLDALAALPEGPVGLVRLADLNDPVRRAVARWDRAVLAHTGTLPLAVDDGWGEDLSD